MNLLRKGFVHLFAIALFASLLGVAAVVNFNRTLAEPDQVKQLLAESGVYDEAVAAALDQSQEDALKEENDSTISLEHTIVQQAAKRVFTPALLEENANKFIDGNYDWLAGKTSTPTFSLDLTQAKADFAQLVGEYTTNRLQTLTVCTPEQLAQLQIPVDPMQVTCLPSGIDPTTEGNRVATEVSQSNFLSKPVITANSFGRDENSQSKPYYERLSKAPKLYQLSQKLPLILAGVALLSALAVIFIAPERRRGWRRAAFMLLFAGIILIGLTFAGKTAVDRVESKLDDSVSSQLAEPRADFLEHLQSRLSQVNLIFGGIYTALAIAIFIALFSSRDAKPKPPKAAKPAPAELETEPDTPKTPAAPTPSQPTSRRPIGMDVVGPVKPTPSPQPKPQTRPATSAPDLPQLKKPAKKRPPRLIQ